MQQIVPFSSSKMLTGGYTRGVEEDTEQEKEGRPRGRPRVFDTEAALEAAMREFWQKGYEGTTLSELTALMHISRPSLYAAFGGKEALFRRVLDRYEAGPAIYLQTAMAAPTGHAAVELLLFGAIDLLADPETPPGCLFSQGVLFGGPDTDAARRDAMMHRLKEEAFLRERFARAISEENLPPDPDAAVLARYFATVVRGLGISALNGASREELLEVARLALQVWPN